MAIITITARSGQTEQLEVKEPLEVIWQFLGFRGHHILVTEIPTREYPEGRKMVINKSYILYVKKSPNEV